MKKFLILSFILIVSIAINLNAQPPEGFGGGGEGGRPGGPPQGRMGGRPTNNIDNKLILDFFPEIPNITLKQREKVGSILTKEHEDIFKQLDKKRELEKEGQDAETEKEIAKIRGKVDKIDKKISDIKEKSDKKIKKELSEDQYQVFIEKRDEFRFKKPQGGMPGERGGERKSQPSLEDDMFNPMFE